jgi:hypothetical protein
MVLLSGSVYATVNVVGEVPIVPTAPLFDTAKLLAQKPDTAVTVIAFAFASNVKLKGPFAAPALMVRLLSTCCESTFPVPPFTSYVVACTESVPAGIFTVNVHVYGPAPGHDPLPGVTLNVLSPVPLTDALCPAVSADAAVSKNFTDFVADET